MSKIKILISCSGVDFSFLPGQEINDISPGLGADLVKHGLADWIEALEADASPEPQPQVTQPVTDPESPETGDGSEETETATPETEDSETANVDSETESEKSETETENMETANVETTPAKPKSGQKGKQQPS